jgi:hypothetical protein
MHAVWTFWSAPFAAHRAAAWGSERAHLLAWALSVETARRHFSGVRLVTDTAGADLLVDQLGLEFDAVSLALDRLERTDRAWWSIGKLVAIAEQREPFVHVDADVFLWSRLPTWLTSAPVFAQNPEPFEAGGSYYRPEAFDAALVDGWLPDEWSWHRQPGVVPRGECCGIVGGNDVEFLRHYAEQALRLVHDPQNVAGLGTIPDRPPLTITVEQYLLAACIEHHRDRAGSPFGDVSIRYLFDSWGQAADENAAAAAGFTHLIADTKRDPGVARRLEERVGHDHPHLHERCLRMTSRRPAMAAASGG